MAFLVKHGGSRAVAGKAAAGARERKPRHGARAAAKSQSRVEAGNRQFAACLLALLACVCVAKLLPVLSSRVSCKPAIIHRSDKYRVLVEETLLLC